MATKNGARFIQEQVDSILPQMDRNDELVISDDHSTDETVQILLAYKDPRIKIGRNEGALGIASNFENSLYRSKGEYIFLADQDDVWAPNKINCMMDHLQQHDLVISDCFIVDHHMRPQQDSFFRFNRSGKGIFKNILKNSYMGCCMAFRRGLLDMVIPFPINLPMHDQWIGLVGELYFRTSFIDKKLVYHRRHDHNASSTSQGSKHSVTYRISYRYSIVKNLIQRSYAM